MTEPSGDPTDTMLNRLARTSNLSKAESAVAQWVETHLQDVPMVNAGDIAQGANVSEMTVTRFVRRLGYDNFKAFKADLHAELREDGAPLRSLRNRRIAIPEGTDVELARQMQLELDAIAEVYALATTPQWQAALDAVHDARHVSIVGFQGSKGLAMDFATRLKYARPGVRYAEGTSGNWSELYLEEPQDTCVVMVDTVPYAQLSLRIAELCLRRKVPLVAVTDRYSGWPRKYTPHALSVSTFTGAFLDSTAGISALLGLFLHGLTARLGPDAKRRLQEMSKLGRYFDAYTFDPGTRQRPVPTPKEDDTP